jgi:hypothetical protein
MRAVCDKDRTYFEYLRVLLLDTLKYRIKDASEKTPIRRAIERKFCQPNEINGLYEQMARLVRSSDASESSEIP